MLKELRKFALSLRNILGGHSSIDEIESLRSFVTSRSSYMAQVSLYGYLKARAGTRYVSLIKDSLFASSMKTARNQIFFACLIDLSLHVLKIIYIRKQKSFQNFDPFARQFFIQTLAKVPEEVFESQERDDVIMEFNKYLSSYNCNVIDDNRESFSGSCSALLKWAPVVEEFKIQDEEIVSNSIHFKWLRVCQEFENLTNFENIILENSQNLTDKNL